MIKEIIVIAFLALAALTGTSLFLRNKDTHNDNVVCKYPAPYVNNIVWGEVTVTEVDGAIKKYKDAKLSPTGSQEWNWKSTGTQHVPGIQVADLKDIIDADVIILSRGMDLILQTKPETEAYLKSLNKEYYILETREAVKKYNELIDAGKKVAALIHSTC